ncbi:hypothetical protein DXG03_000764 [Asterophora parasitica]|uniref:UDP-galactose transporter n=1 Tax=Asterophora parasitica TaxID=117018 RepID=A0A9P7GB26_9AGAR|nr:hypothetical protein DXG03_000764 [Asterophora parasitica]
MAQYPATPDHHDHDPELAQHDPAVPSLAGIPLKHISLVTLATQNSALTLIMHHSRVSTPPSRAYSAATAVLLNEVLKGLISFIIAFYRVEPQPADRGASPSHPAGLHRASIFTSSLLTTIPRRLAKLSRDIFSPDCWKLSIPAILYVLTHPTVIQNNLQYVAASNLDAATFQVTYQMKILTTAAFSVLLLRRKLSPSQWLSLLFLAIGVGIVQIQSGNAHAPSARSPSAATDAHAMNGLKGFLAVAAACFTSGLAGVYFEMVLKNSPADLWVRNVQLSLFSLLPALAPILFASPASSSSLSDSLSGMFANFGLWAWATVLMQVLGGLLTALVIKYSDNILKGFATSLSIVLSFLASVVLFRFRMTGTFVLGSGVVLVATWLYNQPQKRVAVGRGWTLEVQKTTSGGEGEKERYQRPMSRATSTRSSSSSVSSLPSVVITPPSIFDAANEKAMHHYDQVR